ncbi:MAG TPA: hypothetical protein VMU09_05320 [Acidimicrobiales bacterium]|nr:hypothetical protein [Acidimicrobiales bacterium]
MTPTHPAAAPVRHVPEQLPNVANPHRAMAPINNPVWGYDNSGSFRTRQPGNVLDHVNEGADPRLTAVGSLPGARLPAYTPYAGQTPYNVYALRPQ